jgi:hypothetical protein
MDKKAEGNRLDRLERETQEEDFGVRFLENPGILGYF